MRARPNPLLLTCLLVAAAASLPTASAQAQAGVAVQQEAAQASAREFDRLLAQVERGDIVLGTPAEIRSVLRRLEALRPRNDALRDLRLRALRCEYDDLGSPEKALTFARAGVDDARRMRDTGSEIRFRLCEATYIDGSGQIAQSAGPIEEAVALARRAREPRLLARALMRRGGLRSLLGEQAAALNDFLEAQRVFAAAGLRKEAEAGLQDIAIAYRRMGDHDKALEYLRQSIAFAEREQRWSALSAALLQTAFLYEDRGQLDAATEAQRRAVQVASTHGLDYDVAAARLAMASTAVRRGDHAAASMSLAIARSGFERLGDRSNEGMLQLLEGRTLAGQGLHPRAIEHYGRAAAAFESDPNPRYQVDLYAARAQSHEALGNFRAAVADLKREREARQRLAEESRTQQSLLLQYQFDTARREMENARLQADRFNQEQRLASIQQANRWQVAALLSGGLLMALLLGLFLRQLRNVRRIHTLALTDALTGVANRRHVETAAGDAMAQARASGRPLAVLTFDLDGFKRINDTWGHAAGDQVLVRVARTCEAALRQDDLLGRIGGEEFVVLLPNTPGAPAAMVAERLREHVARIPLDDIAPELRVTISIGLAMAAAHDQKVQDVIDRADAALYRAKAAGRNRVVVAGGAEAGSGTDGGPEGGSRPASGAGPASGAVPASAGPDGEIRDRSLPLDESTH